VPIQGKMRRSAPGRRYKRALQQQDRAFGMGARSDCPQQQDAASAWAVAEENAPTTANCDAPQPTTTLSFC